ncbi:MAG: spondin domain-containing protein [Acidobacteriota bacterium]
MKIRPYRVFPALLIAFLALLVAGASSAQETYRIKITNVTRGQVLSPPIVVSHSIRAQVFNVGEPASAELAGVAEDADNGPLVAALQANPEVLEVLQGAGPLPPGATAEFDIQASSSFPRLSIVGMLVQTNDAFYGLDRYPMVDGNRDWRQVIGLPAYDAGSEANNELCAFIPGPPCGNLFVRDTGDAEGYVHVHSGIRGIGDLSVEVYDWRNPAVSVTIIRLDP